MNQLPAPATTPPVGHLWRWARDPIGLLTEGARTASMFRLALWRPAVVGYRPEWNRAVLGDLETFRSRGSLSGLTPYLAGGVVYTDAPEHDLRRRELNPHFHARALRVLTDRLRAVVEQHAPTGRWDALSWSAGVVRRMLNSAFFDGRLPDAVLARFLSPLHRSPPSPFLPRPRLFRQLDAEITRSIAQARPDTLGAALSTMDNAVEEIRVALAAGYDTTAHTLAWALWHIAGAPQWRRPETADAVLDETLRLYPAGWLGSRVVGRDTEVAGVELARGTLVLYSPYLTHRDPDLWPDPNTFHPQRHDGRPAWGFIPFSAGRRTCLGTHLARLILRTALEPFWDGQLRQLSGNPSIQTGITIKPAGPLWLERSGRRTGSTSLDT